VGKLIAIDGPAGAGKSTIAAALARRLGMARLDTGAMYRAVTLLVLENGADPGDEVEAARLAKSMHLTMGDDVALNGRDVTVAIRRPEVDAAVSTVAAHPAVRAELVRRQRIWAAEHGGGVVEGRDIGTVVFPEADLKVYLTADPDERARRRDRQRALADEKTTPGSLSAVTSGLEQRDARDAGRPVSPLLAASDAMVLDSTHLSVDDVLREVLARL
jgi:cytidylate kinase